MKVEAIAALQDNYIWLIYNPPNPQAIVVDPGIATPVLDALKEKNLTLSAIFITHHHWDHTGGIGDLLNHYSVPVYGPANPHIVHVSQKLHEGDTLPCKNLAVEYSIFEIPGHTLDHIAYYGAQQLFCGDTLFTGGCGRLFEGTAEQMLNSLRKILSLPDDTLVYCAHEYTEQNLAFALAVEPDNQHLQARVQQVHHLRQKGLPSVPATLAEEKATNPFLRCHLEQVKRAAEQWIGHKLTSTEAVFATIRQWKNQF